MRPTAAEDCSARNPFGGGGDDGSRDAVLVRSALDGRREALEELVRRHQPWVFNIALRMLWNRVDAEDATQATINVNVTGSNFVSGVVCTGPLMVSNGSLTIEQTAGPPFGTAGCCTGDETGVLHCRATIDRLCDISESIVGSFEVDGQCADGTTCSRQVHFLTPRDS